MAGGSQSGPFGSATCRRHSGVRAEGAVVVSPALSVGGALDYQGIGDYPSDDFSGQAGLCNLSPGSS